MPAACCGQPREEEKKTGVHTKSGGVRGRVAVELVDANDSVVGAGCEVAAVWREADRVDGAEVVAHVAELARFARVDAVRLEDGRGRPDADVAICSVQQAVVFLGILKQPHQIDIPPPAVASLEPSGEMWQL